METKRKELYEAPSTMVFELKQEGVICASTVNTLLWEVESYPQWKEENI